MNVVRMFCIGALAALGLAFATSPVIAQRGMGEQVGVARMPEKPEIVTLSGKLTAINVGPCEQTTGHARVGVHLVVEPAAPSSEGATKAESFNIHVGPAAVVQEMLTKFPIGTQLTIAAFRTDKMPTNHYVAQSLKSDTATVTLRDESLRPVWAGTRGASDGRGMQGRGPGYGRGYGYHRGYGYRQANCPRQQMMR